MCAMSSVESIYVGFGVKGIEVKQMPSQCRCSRLQNLASPSLSEPLFPDLCKGESPLGKLCEWLGMFSEIQMGSLSEGAVINGNCHRITVSLLGFPLLSVFLCVQRAHFSLQVFKIFAFTWFSTAPRVLHLPNRG